jgi:hypothetical protein
VAEDTTSWKRCNTCKKPIAFGSGYFTCNVSTCNRKGTDFAFCSVACWDAHVPVYRHRDAWAEEQRAPSAAAWAAQQREQTARATAPPIERKPHSAAASPPRAANPSHAASPPHAQAQNERGSAVAEDVLVVVSKMKAYIRAQSGMNTSDGVAEVLSARVRELCDAAIERARAAGRKTVMDRDFER